MTKEEILQEIEKLKNIIGGFGDYIHFTFGENDELYKSIEEAERILYKIK